MKRMLNTTINRSKSEKDGALSRPTTRNSDTFG